MKPTASILETISILMCFGLLWNQEHRVRKLESMTRQVYAEHTPGFYYQPKVTNDPPAEMVTEDPWTVSTPKKDIFDIFEYPTNYVVYSNMIWYGESGTITNRGWPPPFPLTDITLSSDHVSSNWFTISYSSRLVRKWLDKNIGDRGFVRDTGVPMQCEVWVNPCYSAEAVRVWIESHPWR